MHIRFALLALAASTSLAACGGGGSGTNALTPVTQRTPAPTTAPQTSNAPLTESVAGAPAFVNPANHHTLYFVDGDTPPGAACSGSCIAEWPVLSPTAASQPQANFTIVARVDGTKQWSYRGHALYEFAGDSGPDQSNGVYGTWHMARPSAQ